MPTFIDSHIHLNSPLYGDVTPLIDRAKSRGIEAWIVPGTTLDDIPSQISLKKRFKGIYPAFGIHPWFLENIPHNWSQLLARSIETNLPVAIGECGLDYSHELPLLQREVFTKQLDMAQDFSLPLIIHSYKAVDDVLREIRKRSNIKGVLHGFNGSLQQLEQAIELGFYIGFGGAVTYSRAKNLQRLLEAVPLERLLLETDGPFQRGAYRQANELHLPEDLFDIAQFVAEQKSLELSDLAKITTNNCIELFNLELK